MIKVQLFGNFSIEYEGKQLMSKKNITTKSMQLFQILLYRHPEGIGRKELMDNLFGRGDVLADPSNNLRVSVHRLRKMLSDMDFPDEELIVNDGERLYWNCSIPLWVDTYEFDKHLAAFREARDQDKKLAHSKMLCELYSGDFLEKLSGEDWVVLEAMEYKHRYEESLSWLCEYLQEQGRCEELLPHIMKACELYPLDEWQTEKIRCLIGMDRYEEAMKVYQDTSALYFSELGINPTEEMVTLFHEMSQHIDSVPQEITDFKQKIREKEKAAGAYYCPLPSFVDGYRILRRMMERTGQSIFLMLCSLTDGYGNPMENKEKVSAMAQELKDAIAVNLRKGDTFTQCSPSQFLLLLPGAQEENCGLISGRITKRFCEKHKYWKNCIRFFSTSVMDQEDIELELDDTGLLREDSLEK